MPANRSKRCCAAGDRLRPRAGSGRRVAWSPARILVNHQAQPGPRRRRRDQHAGGTPCAGEERTREVEGRGTESL